MSRIRQCLRVAIVLAGTIVCGLQSCSDDSSNPVQSSPPRPLSCTINLVDPTHGAAPLAVNFAVEATGGTSPYTYRWTFGDGGSATTTDPAHTFANAGKHNVRVTITDQAGKSEYADTTVEVTAPAATRDIVLQPASPLLGSSAATSGGSLIIKAGSARNSGNAATAAFSVGFYLSSDAVITTSDILLRRLNFPALSPAAVCFWPDQSVTIPAAVPTGNYYVGIWADDGSSTVETNETNNTAVAQVSITQGQAALSCIATANPTVGTTPLAVSFDLTASGGTPPYTYRWTFGDNSSSTSARTSHTYTLAGIFTATGRVTDNTGATCEKTVTINVGLPGLNCSASATPTSGTVPLTVTLTGSASNGTPPYQYAWIVQPNDTLRQQNTTYTFRRPGTFGIQFVVVDSRGALATKQFSIQVNAAAALTCTASAVPTTGTAPLTVNFTGGASGGVAPYTWSWQFGDGQSSTLQNPSHQYQQAGTYTCVLTVRDAANTTCSKSVSIVATGSPLSCQATGSPTSGVAPLSVSFGATATGGRSPYSYAWSFGDGATSAQQNPTHSYAAAGTYRSIVTVTDANLATCRDTVTITATQPVPGPVLSGPASSTGTFTLSWSFSWPPLAGSNDRVSIEQKVGSGAYSEIAQVLRSSGSQLQLTRSAGTYTYRCRAYFAAGGSGQWTTYSNEVTVVVSAPVSKTRFNNNSTYFIVSLKIDNVEQFTASPQGLLPGYYYEKTLSTGTHSFAVLFGFWNEYGSREYLYQTTGTFTQREGITEQINITGPTIAQLLTKFGSSGTWSAWVPGYVNKVVFKFYANGTFTFTNLSGGTSTGNFSFVSRNATSWAVTFAVPGYQGVLYEYLGYFVMYNGPGNGALQYFYDGP